MAFRISKLTALLLQKALSTDTDDFVTLKNSAGTTKFKISKDGAITSGPVSAAGLGVFGVAHAIYDFTVDGGASCTPASTALIPANALLLGATINSTVALTAVGSATLGVGTTAGSTTTSILAATAKATLSLDAVLNGVPTFAVPVKMTAAGSISVLIATGPLTAGQVEIFVYYVVPANA